MPTRFSVATAAAVVVACGFAAVSADTPSTAQQFYSAIRTNDLSRLQVLATQNPNARDERDVTPLMHAAAVGSLDAMRLLVGAGADVNAANAIGSTALMWSVSDIARVQLLLDHGADVNARSSHNRTALFIAAMSDRSADTVRLLLANGAKTDGIDTAHMTVLHAATVGGDAETIRLIVEAGADVNAADTGDYTPLMNAAQRGNLSAVKLLLAKGAKVNAVSGRGDIQTHSNKGVKNGPLALGSFTPLLIAAATAPVEVIRTLLDAGADINAVDIRGMTPLMTAVATDHADLDVVRLLLARSADVQRKSLDGETALDWADKFGVTPVVRLLQAAGAKAAAAEPMTVPPAAPVALRAAITRSMTLMETTTGQYFGRGGCAACHAHNITDVAVGAARARGLPVDQELASTRLVVTKGRFASAAPLLLERLDTAGTPDQPLNAIVALASIGYPADQMTDGMIANIAAQQLADGRWFLGGIARPPIEDGDITRTALAIRALQVYAPPARGAEMNARIARAAAWLTAATAATTQDRNMRLLGLFWSGADRERLQPLAKNILAKQRHDGGWAQLDELASDAYATGQTIYALAEATGGAASARGVQYLLSNQRADGSWHVRSRAPRFQPYFDSGFPYGSDQWISSMATGWATAALATAVKKPSLTHEDR